MIAHLNPSPNLRGETFHRLAQMVIYYSTSFPGLLLLSLSRTTFLVPLVLALHIAWI